MLIQQFSYFWEIFYLFLGEFSLKWLFLWNHYSQIGFKFCRDILLGGGGGELLYQVCSNYICMLLWASFLILRDFYPFSGNCSLSRLLWNHCTKLVQTLQGHSLWESSTKFVHIIMIMLFQQFSYFFERESYIIFEEIFFKHDFSETTVPELAQILQGHSFGGPLPSLSNYAIQQFSYFFMSTPEPFT